MEFSHAAALHRERYPLMQGQDWLKICYQAEFGAGHMITDPAACRKRLKEEFENSPANDQPLFEPIGGGLCRLNLGPLHHEGIDLEAAARLFEITAQPRGSVEGLEEKLALVKGEISAEELAAYRQAGYPAVSHSEVYRKAYGPAYRLAPQWAEAFWPLIKGMDQARRSHGRILVAIDGMSGSGKSTLGARLQTLFGGSLIHMDDFFLPQDRKTPQRLAEPGGNVDYERFQQEVLIPLEKERPFSYRPFMCHTGSLGEPVQVNPQPVTIVEGCYSLHPALEAAYDLRVFLKLDPQTQKLRILERNGEAMYLRFAREWIPLENAYFEAFGIAEKCHWVFT